MSLLGPAERALKARGVSLQALTFDDPRHDIGQEGFILAEPLADGSALFIALARESLPPERREAVAAWTLTKVDTFLAYGPGRDRWSRRNVDGAWQIWMNEQTTPSGRPRR
ncbi:MAG TPA: hypothetical protein VHX15_18545 [Frankiaceae bacterium]|nr:hypothetical protein [Frankiaceae bacterium]